MHAPAQPHQFVNPCTHTCATPSLYSPCAHSQLCNPSPCAPTCTQNMCNPTLAHTHTHAHTHTRACLRWLAGWLASQHLPALAVCLSVPGYVWIRQSGCLRSRGKKTTHPEQNTEVGILFNSLTRTHKQTPIVDNPVRDSKLPKGKKGPQQQWMRWAMPAQRPLLQRARFLSPALILPRVCSVCSTERRPLSSTVSYKAKVEHLQAKQIFAQTR